jgi:hypothetical protein
VQARLRACFCYFLPQQVDGLPSGGFSFAACGRRAGSRACLVVASSTGQRTGRRERLCSGSTAKRGALRRRGRGLGHRHGGRRWRIRQRRHTQKGGARGGRVPAAGGGGPVTGAGGGGPGARHGAGSLVRSRGAARRQAPQARAQAGGSLCTGGVGWSVPGGALPVCGLAGLVIEGGGAVGWGQGGTAAPGPLPRRVRAGPLTSPPRGAARAWGLTEEGLRWWRECRQYVQSRKAGPAQCARSRRRAGGAGALGATEAAATRARWPALGRGGRRWECSRCGVTEVEGTLGWPAGGGPKWQAHGENFVMAGGGQGGARGTLLRALVRGATGRLQRLLLSGGAATLSTAAAAAAWMRAPSLLFGWWGRREAKEAGRGG